MKTADLINMNVDLLTQIAQLRKEITELKCANLVLKEKIKAIDNQDACSDAFRKTAAQRDKELTAHQKSNHEVTMTYVEQLGNDIHSLMQGYLSEVLDNFTVQQMIGTIDQYLLAKSQLRFLADYHVYSKKNEIGEQQLCIDMKMNGSPDDTFNITYTLG